MKAWSNLILTACLFGAFILMLSSPARAAILLCTNCATCNSQIQNAVSGDTVQLTQDINNQPGGCITFGGKDGITFGCTGHTIRGDGLTPPTPADNGGIWLPPGSNNNRVQNCIVRTFTYGLHITSSTGNTIQGLTLSGSHSRGIYVETSSGNTVRNIVVSSSAESDLRVIISSDTHCNNDISDITGSGNRPIRYFNSPVNLHDETLSELILCNADYSTITNVDIIASYGINGMYVMNTDYSQFTNMNSSYNRENIFSSSSHNSLSNITVSFTPFGIEFSRSSYNTLSNINASYNSWQGLKIGTYSDSNILTNITTNYNNYGMHIVQSRNNIITNVTAKENTIYDLYFNAPDYRDCTNTINNFTGSGDRPYKFFNRSVNLQDEVLSGIVLCNADYSTVNNITIIDSATRKNNGFSIQHVDRSNFSNINSSYGYAGVSLFASDRNNFTNLTTNGNVATGISLSYSQYNIFRNVTADFNENGIYVSDSHYNAFIDVYTRSNTATGFGFGSANLNQVTNLTSTGNLRGITFSGDSKSNVVNNSRVENNTFGISLLQFVWGGIYYLPRYNTFYNNIINNSNNVYSTNENNLNYWNITLDCSAGPNIIGGVPIAGNYWGSPSGGGYSDICDDLNSRGMCDNPYTPAVNNTDYLPLDIPGPDTLPPTIVFSLPTPQNNTILPSDYIGVNATMLKTPNSCLDETADSCILDWYDGVSWRNYTMAKSGYSCYIVMAGLLPDIVYQYMVYANDSAGNMNVSETRQNNVSDITPPGIIFVPPTPDNMAVVRSDYIEVNVSVSEPAGTCLIDWYDGTWWNYTMDAAPGGVSCYLNMTDLANGVYRFRVYAADMAGNMNVSETRQNTVAYVGPAFVLAKFSVSTLHSQLGENRIIKMYVKNPDPVFANITIWLGGDYPTDLAKFSNQPPQRDAYFTADMRNLTVGLNPKNQVTFSVIILSTGPKDGGYNLTLRANTTGSAKKDSDSLQAFADYPANFPGLEPWAMLLLLALSGFAYWKIKK